MYVESLDLYAGKLALQAIARIRLSKAFNGIRIRTETARRATR